MKQAKRKLSNKRAATPTDQLLGQRLRARRLERHVSQSDLGEAIGVSFQQVQKYEKGVNRIGSARLAQIASVLDTPIAYFMGDLDGEGYGPSPLSAFMATRDGVDIIEAMMKLDSPVLRRSVIDLARKLGRAYAAQA